MPEFNGVIRTDVRDSTPDWTPFMEPAAPEGAPNVLFIVWDDMGFGSWDLYGGLIRMPAMRRIAELGVRFTQFHTTALCSPTRAALLTGRNAQSNGMGTVGEFSDGFPNISCLVPAENAFISEILSANGYNTFAIGKWHLTPTPEMGMGGSKRTWPLSRGFDRFYGFLGGLTDQWYPELTYDNHPVDAPATPEEGYHLSKDLADRAIQFIADAGVTAPGKPWFTYFAPGACHAPHHVATEWADRYRGEFSMGYERYREQVLENQIKLGIVPPGTELPAVNPYGDATGPGGKGWNESDLVRPWDELSETDQALFARQAEVYAGYASYTDAQIGRLLDYLEESGQLDSTLIVVLSDNGASAEGGPNGSVNENRWYNGVPENSQENLRLLPELGTQATHPHFSNGWAMAFNTPHKLYKTYASLEGGVADPMILAWPNGLEARGEVRQQYAHVTDIVPTVLELIGMPQPAVVKGHEQTPFEGISLHEVVVDDSAANAKREQFYCMLGTRGVWSDGWHASTVHPPSPSGWGGFDQDRWELFYLPDDRNQLHDRASAEPGKLAELVALWDRMAREYNGYPLDDRNVQEIFQVQRPDASRGASSMTLRPGGVPVPERSGIQIAGRSFSIAADLESTAEAEGVIYALGGRFGGHALFIAGGRVHYVYNWLGESEQLLSDEHPLTAGRHQVGVTYQIEGRKDDGSPYGTATLFVDDKSVATKTIKTQPSYFSLSGEGATAGRDVGQAVSSQYSPPFPFHGGQLHGVVVDASGEGYAEAETVLRGMFARD